MNRIWYRILWVFEVLAIAFVALLLTLRIQDYARREFSALHEPPSPETLKAVQDKQHEEFHLLLSSAAPVATLALLVAFPLFRHRRRPST